MAHFAHANGTDCPGAGETAIHLLAKEVLNEFKTLMLPPIYKGGLKLNEKQAIVFDKAELEKRFSINDESYIQPDAILYKNTQRIFIEFYKTHATEYEKIEKIEKLGISCLEIDLNYVNPLLHGKVNRNGIRKLLEEYSKHKTWLYNTKAEDLYHKKIARKNELEAKQKKEKKRKYEELRKRQILANKIWEEELKEEERLQELKWEKEDKAYKESLDKHRQELTFWKKQNIKEGSKILKVYSNKETGSYLPIVYCPEHKLLGEKEIRMEFRDCKTCKYNNGYVGFETNDRSNVLFACGFGEKVQNQENSLSNPFTSPPNRDDFNGIFDQQEDDSEDLGYFD